MEDVLQNFTVPFDATPATDTGVYNVSVPKWSDSATTATLKFYDIFVPLFGTFIVLMNLAVVISSLLILKRGNQLRSTYIFMGNMALADLVTGLAVIFGQYYPRSIRNENSCAVQIGMIVSTTVTSVYSVGLIAIDRYLYIIYGMHYQRWIDTTRRRLLIAVTWIIGGIIGFLPLMGWRGDTQGGKVCWFILLAPPQLITLTTVVGFIPMCIVVVLYSIILYHAIKKVTQLNMATQNTKGAQDGKLRVFRGGGASSGSTNNILEQQPSSTSQASLTGVSKRNGSRAAGSEQVNSDLEQSGVVSEPEEPMAPKSKFVRFFRRNTKPAPPTTQPTKKPSKWKAIKVVMLTSGSFVICWMPYFIAATIFAHNCPDSFNPDIETGFCKSLKLAVASPLAILGFMNSLFNPIIYAWWHNGFRESVKKMYRKTRCGQKKEDPTMNRPRPTMTTGTSSTSVNSSGASDQESSDVESTRPVARRTTPQRANASMSPDPTTTTPKKPPSNLVISTPAENRITSTININLEQIDNPGAHKEHKK